MSSFAHSYAVTGASGQLGRLVVEDLLDRGVPASEVVAIVRTPAKVADLAERGVQVRRADYGSPEVLPDALAGVRRVLLVSGTEVGQRVVQHSAVIEAAKAAGVERILYTSVLRADTSTTPVAPEHKATEEVLAESGLAYTVLRNGWYVENYTPQLGTYVEQGELLGAAGKGRLSAATRADYARAAAAALVEDGDENVVYELGGDAFDYAELAGTISEVTGAAVGYRDLTPNEYVSALRAAGLDEGTAAFLAASDEAIARGDLQTDSDDLTRLIGRPSTSLADAIRAAL